VSRLFQGALQGNLATLQLIDGKDWTSVEQTHDAETTISGLAAATRYSFRFRAWEAEGLGEWSRVVSVVVG
jgi:hypothetical protein